MVHYNNAQEYWDSVEQKSTYKYLKNFKDSLHFSLKEKNLKKL